MKKIHFEVKTDGFYGAYWKNKKETNSAIIAMLGDDAEDYMAKSCVKWLMKKGVNVLTMLDNSQGNRQKKEKIVDKKFK